MSSAPGSRRDLVRIDRGMHQQSHCLSTVDSRLSMSLSLNRLRAGAVIAKPDRQRDVEPHPARPGPVLQRLGRGDRDRRDEQRHRRDRLLLPVHLPRLPVLCRRRRHVLQLGCRLDLADVPAGAIGGVEEPLWTETLRSDAEAEYQTTAPTAAGVTLARPADNTHVNGAYRISGQHEYRSRGTYTAASSPPDRTARPMRRLRFT